MTEQITYSPDQLTEILDASIGVAEQFGTAVMLPMDVAAALLELIQITPSEVVAEEDSDAREA